jgi:hypothetical protein
MKRTNAAPAGEEDAHDDARHAETAQGGEDG